jgi:hypothetical protein
VSASPRIVSITVGDEPESWARAGFAVGADGGCPVGTVRIDLVGRQHGKRIQGWTLRDLAPGGLPVGELDGIPTGVSEADPPPALAHPNGVTSIDHVVLATPDPSRTIAAFESAGFDVRGERRSDTYGAPMRQTFFRAGEVILELITADDDGPSPESSGSPAGPAGFFGLAFTVGDLDGLADQLGDDLGTIKDAVQPGRRIATLRHRQLDISVPIAFMTAERGAAPAR